MNRRGFLQCLAALPIVVAGIGALPDVEAGPVELEDGAELYWPDGPPGESIRERYMREMATAMARKIDADILAALLA